MDSMQEQEVQIRKRVACEERAFNVVLRLIDEHITEDYLSDACQLITPSHYADVVEERSIAKLCAYPLCGNTLGKVSKQQYQISTKNNMVYDITERKKFCSNLCLKSSQYLEKQISTSPVWARQQEPRINFQFLQIPSKSCSMGDAVFLPLPQTELKKAVKTLEKLDRSAPSAEKRGKSTNGNPATEDSSNLLSDVVDRMAKVKISYAKEVDGINVDFSEDEHTISKSPDPREISHKTGEITQYSTECEESNECVRDNTDLPLSHSAELKVTKPTTPRDGAEDIESGSKESDVKARTGRQEGETTEEYVMRLLERKKHLLGQLADIQQNQGETTPQPQGGTGDGGIDSDEEEEDSESCHSESARSDKPPNYHSSIEEISKLEEQTNQKPSIEEISHPKSTKSIKMTHLSPSTEDISSQKAKTASPGSRKSPVQKDSAPASVRLKPLNAVARVMEEWFSRDTFKLLNMCPTDTPSDDTSFDKNYAKLCRKVAEDERDFENLLGEESVEDSNSTKHLPMPDYKKLEAETEMNELRVREFYRGSAGGGRRQKGSEEVQSRVPARTVQLPVVDSHDQMTIRRKIVLDRLNRVIPDILNPLRLSIQDVSQPIRELVFTFSLSSKNILFKPGEWSLVGILLLKLLALKSKQIKLSFAENSAVRYFQIILASLGHTMLDLDEVVKEMMSFDSQIEAVN